jgi:hypothetical protein
VTLELGKLCDMKNAVFIITLLLSSVAWAGEPINLTIQQTRELYIALSALDGYDKVVKDGANEKIVKTPYVFGGGLRLAIGRNLLAIAPTVQAFDKANRELALQYSNGKDKLEGEPLVKFQNESQKMGEAKTTADLIKIKPSELKLDENPIPGSAIAGLQAILTND